MKAIATALFLIISISLEAQILGNFNAAQTDSTVLIKWTIKGGNTCNGIAVERAAGDLVFEEIHYISGVCGSNDHDEHYSHIDTAPLPNTVNHYRLLLGSTDYSDTISAHFLKVDASGVAILHNPGQEVTIQFLNNTHDDVHFFLFDQSGSQVLKKQTKGTSFTVGAWELPSGVYLFSLEKEGAVFYTGKVVLQ